MQYLFGDSDIAAQRLKVVADVFAETTRNFVLDTVTGKPDISVDLGCGPGQTTCLLSEVLQSSSTIGLDNSEHFISLTQKIEQRGVSFYLHDVTSVPFPVGPSDIVYCRFLLSHLKDPQTLLARWATQLKLGGLLLIDEVECILTANKAFSAYLAIVAAMLTAHSAELYVGPILNRLPGTSILERRVSQISRLRVSNRQAAAMFSLNMQSWKQQPFVQENYSPSAIAELEDELRRLAMKESGASEIEWGLRQIVFERI